MEPVYRFHFTVTSEAVDVNRHVNNVAYVQWMQDVAIQHANATGCTMITKAAGAIWVARSHHIDYLSPAFAGDAITLMTWIAGVRKVRSTRRYKFIRDSDEAILARGETEWVFVDAATGRPRSIPEKINDAFGVYNDEPEN
jgi:acyl-CoA thioester hydrolase